MYLTRLFDTPEVCIGIGSVIRLLQRQISLSLECQCVLFWAWDRDLVAFNTTLSPLFSPFVLVVHWSLFPLLFLSSIFLFIFSKTKTKIKKI